LFCAASARGASLIVFVGLALSVLTSCSGGGQNTTNNPPPRTLSSIAVSSDKTSVAAGLTAQFKATGTYSDASNADITSAVAWASGTPGVATINASGLATTKAQGSTSITATSGSVTGSATLAVDPAALLSIAVRAATVQLGSTTQMKATATYTDQTTQDLTSGVAWSSTNGYVASVSASGVVTSIGAGNSAVTATEANLKGTAAVTVLASPRYLYVSADAGRTITHMAVDGTSGQPRFAGYGSSSISKSVSPA
jgi:trimeric autotransporter adhesin